MKVSRAQAEENKKRILRAASRLFRQNGLDGVGIDGIMKDAGLTHGGFYGHFASKDDLAAEACGRSFTRSAARWAELAETQPETALAEIVGGYLSARHRDDPGTGCSLAALAGDMARQQGGVRHGFTQSLRSHIDTLTKLLGGRGKAARREKAVATMAGLVGAMVLARAVDDPAFSDEILDASAKIFGGATAER
jgi:TetR/AcrR family transcriptional repressor of nem operon